MRYRSAFASTTGSPLLLSRQEPEVPRFAESAHAVPADGMPEELAAAIIQWLKLADVTGG